VRSLEFLWQEGHTCHATAAEADERARQMLGVYRDFLEQDLAIPVIAGVKTESEKFAGALRTHTVEAMTGGKFWALQAGTSHDLGDHFGKVFDIRFLDRDGERKTAYSTSWGLSHRVVGATVMVHGDDAGLKLPPKVAPEQVVIVPIWRNDGERAVVLRAAETIAGLLGDRVRVRLDDREEVTPGRKFAEWELKGVPVRLEIGPRDVAAEQVVLVRRDLREKQAVRLSELQRTLEAMLGAIQDGMLAAARWTLAKRTASVDELDEFAERVSENAGWSRVHWCGSPTCEEQIKAQTKATIRCIPYDAAEEAGDCLVCGDRSARRVIAARAY
jgi:prolyl-tRNA synthetase